MTKKRKEEIINYLSNLKFTHEANALREMSTQVSEQFAKREKEKAALVQEIIEIVKESFRPYYVDIDDLLLKPNDKIEKRNILPSFIGYDPETGQEEYEPRCEGTK